MSLPHTRLIPEDDSSAWMNCGESHPWDPVAGRRSSLVMIAGRELAKVLNTAVGTGSVLVIVYLPPRFLPARAFRDGIQACG